MTGFPPSRSSVTSPKIYCCLFNSPLPWGEKVGDIYDICTCVRTHCKTLHFIFCSSNWEKLFLYWQRGRCGRPRSPRAGEVPGSGRPAVPVPWLCRHAGTTLPLAQPAAAGSQNLSPNFIFHEVPNNSICAMEEAHQTGRQKRRQHWILHCFLSLISCGVMAALSLLTLFISISRL